MATRRLRFEDADLERDYLARELDRYPGRQTILGFVSAALVWIALAVMTRVMLAHDYPTVVLVTTCVNTPFLLGCAAIVAFAWARLPVAAQTAFPLVTALVPGLSLAVAQALVPAYAVISGPVVGGLGMAVHSYMALRFRSATYVTCIVITSYAVALVFVSPPGPVLFYALAFALGGALIGMQMSYRTERYRRRDFHNTRLLRAEQERSERLIHNMLPPAIAARLKRDPSSIADHFDAVSVLFADLAGFTRMSERVTPAEVVALLNRVFTRFDQLTEEAGLEKIKTIGDAYMVAGGLTVPRDDHAAAICDLAMAMRSALGEVGVEGLDMRIGIHTGPVVAGVIGKSKFVYDLWGDTVNTASRMESHGQPGSIQITEETRRALGDEFAVEERGAIDVKGKGPMRTYWLRARA